MKGRSRHIRVNLEYCVDAKQKDHLRTQPGDSKELMLGNL
jgi:hypothetical protein